MRLRFMLRGLMAFVLGLAVILASLRAPTGLWANGMFSLAVLVSGVAMLGMLAGRGERRVTWLGAFIFGSGYLLLCYGPWFDSNIAPRLLTTALLDRRYRAMDYSPRATEERVWLVESRDLELTRETSVIPPPDRDTRSESVRTGDAFWVETDRGDRLVTPGELRPLSFNAFRQLCHSDASLILAFLGAVVARCFADSRERNERRGDLR